MPCLSAMLARSTCVGAEVAIQTASMPSFIRDSFSIISSQLRYVRFAPVHSCSSARQFGCRSATQTTSTFGCSWKPNVPPNLHTPWPAMPTRSLRSVNGVHAAFVARPDPSPKPAIFLGASAPFAAPAPAASAATVPTKKFFLLMSM